MMFSVGLHPSSFLPVYPSAFFLTLSSSVLRQVAARQGSGPYLGGAERLVYVDGEALLFV